MLHCILPFIVALQLLLALNCGSCLKPHEIKPYEQIFEMQLREPPIQGNIPSKHYDEIKEQWLEQPLDHFDAGNTGTWMMVIFLEVFTRKVRDSRVIHS